MWCQWSGVIVYFWKMVVSVEFIDNNCIMTVCNYFVKCQFLIGATIKREGNAHHIIQSNTLCPPKEDIFLTTFYGRYFSSDVIHVTNFHLGLWRQIAYQCATVLRFCCGFYQNPFMGVLAIFSTGTYAIIGTTCVESETCYEK